MSDHPVHFVPEGVDPTPGVWQIEEGDTINACVDLRNKRGIIPRARTRASEQVRLHEMAHVANTDEHEHESEMGHFICRMLEEIRVDAILYQQRGIDVRCRHDDYDWEDTYSKTASTPFGQAMLYLQIIFQAMGPITSQDVKDVATTIRGKLPAPLNELLDTCVRNILGNPTPEERERLQKILVKYFMPPPPPPPPTSHLKPEVADEIIRQIVQEDEEERERKRKQAEKEAPKTGQKIETKKLSKEEEAELEALLGDYKSDKKPGGGMGHVSMFGHAEVHDHIARSAKTQHVKAPFTRTGRGMVPEFMEHYLVDRRIYRTEHRGGVLIIDTSGSMRPNWPLIQQSMHDFPNIVTLSYGGVTTERQRLTGANGRICVHSKNGRIDPNFMMEPGRDYGNDVDIEALDYATRFKGPKVWVSDGGAGGGNYNKLGGETRLREIMHRHHMVRVKTLEDALAWITRSRPVTYYLGANVHKHDAHGSWIEDPDMTRTGRRQ